jgi:predicted transcriptional regulator
MPRPTSRNFHVPMPEALYERLRKEAEQSAEPATEIARQAIVEFLEKRRRDALYSAINDYAKRHAGTRLDLDEELEAASLEHLGAAREEAE